MSPQTSDKSCVHGKKLSIRPGFREGAMTAFCLRHGWSIQIVARLAILLRIGIGAPTSTYLSGFGSRSVKKTIFPPKTNSTSPLSTPQSIANAMFSQNLKLVSEEPKLWARRSRDPDILWFQTRDSNGNAVKTFSISALDQAGDWSVEEQFISRSSDVLEDWIPIEGIFGLYQLPSGVLWVLITKSKPWYTAPPLQSYELNDLPWWQIRKAANFELVHLSSPGMMLSTAHLKEEVRQLRLLRQSLKEHGFYFVPRHGSSVINDMTYNIQDSLETHLRAQRDSHSLWWEDADRRPDPRFVWNQAAIDPILHRYEAKNDDSDEQSILSELLQHIIPLSSAFVGVQSNVTDETTGLTYDEILISRRSRFRAGTRFTRRGADASGAVANFAETEQICLALNGTYVQHVVSHLQTRGSIPLRWSSPADVKTYRPRVRIGTNPLAQARALRLHLLEQFSYYVEPEDRKVAGKVVNASSIAKLVFVNLIDKKKDQGRLGRAFDAVLHAVMDVYAVTEEHLEEPPPRLYDLYKAPPETDEHKPRKFEEEMLSDPNSVRHVWFDFHAEVKDGRWDRLSGLLETLQPALDSHGYFWAVAPNGTFGWSRRQKQTAIVRTNCMDCLDRTNVVQSLFGRYVLFQQLLKLAKEAETPDELFSTWKRYADTFNKTPSAIPWSSGEIAHRLLWADNADAISRLYAGTPALKGDFTRTGQRTRRGALDDGMNSLQRYYLNNFLDADRQEGMDLLVGYTGFSNTDEMDRDYADSVSGENEKKTDETSYISIKQAARENFFGKLIGSMEAEERAEIQEQLGVLSSGDDESEELEEHPQGVDLRWLPGDLQSHMISNADMLLVEESAEKIADKSEHGSFEFSSIKALGDIDRRSTSDVPWWAEYDDESDTDDSTGNSDLASYETENYNGASFSENDFKLPDYQRPPRLEKAQILALLLVGIRSPLGLAAAVVSLLGIILLPNLLL